MTGLTLGEYIRPGDLVVVGQGTGEPTALLEQLIDEFSGTTEIEIFVGLSHSAALRRSAAADLPLVSFGAMGPLAPLAAGGSVAVIPCNVVDVPELLRLRSAGRLVVLIQVGPADEHGFHSLGTAVDYTYDLVEHARVVVAEVNQQYPTTSSPTLHSSAFTAVLESSRPVIEVADAEADEVLTRLAKSVASLVPDGATIQLGVGAVPAAVGAALADKRGLRVHSALAGNWLLTLARSGALSREPGSVAISEAAGSSELYEYVTEHAQIRPITRMNASLVEQDGLVAINSALQVDLTGQVNAEEIASGYVGGIGGQADLMRAAQRSPGGRAILMLPSTAGVERYSRIVSRLHGGTVTTPRASVDFVVTEYGIADLRSRSLTERADALIDIAAPEHRDALRATRATR